MTQQTNVRYASSITKTTTIAVSTIQTAYFSMHSKWTGSSTHLWQPWAMAKSQTGGWTVCTLPSCISLELAALGLKLMISPSPILWSPVVWVPSDD